MSFGGSMCVHINQKGCTVPIADDVDWRGKGAGGIGEGAKSDSIVVLNRY